MTTNQPPTLLEQIKMLDNKLSDVLLSLTNEHKLLKFVVHRKRNYHRGKITFRHLNELYKINKINIVFVKQFINHLKSFQNIKKLNKKSNNYQIIQ